MRTDYFADFRVHTILYLEKVDWITCLHQSFKKTLVIVMLKTVSTEHSCWKLFGISDKNKSLAAHQQRKKCGDFDRLASLINNNCIEFDFSTLENRAA